MKTDALIWVLIRALFNWPNDPEHNLPRDCATVV